MKFFKMIRNTTIMQRVGIVATILFLLFQMDYRRGFEFTPKMLVPIVIGWGVYWIIIGIIEKRKNK